MIKIYSAVQNTDKIFVLSSSGERTFDVATVRRVTVRVSWWMLVGRQDPLCCQHRGVN
jgi:hypothetical protein